MGTDADRESDGDAEPVPDRAALVDRLGTEAITFVDTLGEELATLIDTADGLQFEYVVGEVSDYGVSSNEHVHFDLVHGDASVHCVLFGYRRRAVDAELEDGQQVAVQGDLSYYADGGQVSVIVSDVVVVGAGAYRQTYERRRQALAEDGLLAAEAKQSLPARPGTVGLVTSAGSDARADAVTSLHGRDPDVDVVIADTTVQGDDALASLMRGISTLDEDPSVDVIVVTRGGGADKQLRVFDEPPLCRVIHRTTTPVVVAVGHETDRTLAGAVADDRVMTPTEVGQIVPRKADLVAERDDLATRLDTAYQAAVTDRLDAFERRLNQAYERRVDTVLADFERRFEDAYDQFEREHGRKHERPRHRRQRRWLVLALLALALLVVALVLYVLFT